MADLRVEGLSQPARTQGRGGSVRTRKEGATAGRQESVGFHVLGREGGRGRRSCLFSVSSGELYP